MRKTERIGNEKFTFKCSVGNTTITGVPLGKIGMWVAKMGGDDLTIEELILSKKATFNDIKFEIAQEGKR